MKIKHQSQLLYFQVDKDLICMNIISTFYIIVIIYQSLIYKYMGKFESPCNLNIFFIQFSYIIKKNYVKLTINSIKCSMISK
jgi:hypothetical protein